ncbi:MAG: NifB/NifX family molybdenum-iron cluster-binding protein [Candidatus Electryonea clarkiae]|nr:NifB/NifX family molybdenum-iron cluster-binding protein [Candidatus Electryonea clarkiae]MDP8287639.1 NifB/NifX family molybdenum-iron cluster-binding protein [Candidatus Electryonea clarkiae]
MTAKIAVTSDDGIRVCMHFGQTPLFVIFTVEDGSITNRELRSNSFTPHMRGEHGQNESESQGGGGHNCGPQVAQGLSDCKVLICGGIGMGAINLLERAGIGVVSTRFMDVDESVNAYLEGTMSDVATACKES